MPKVKTLLFIITILAFFLRFYRVWDIPPSLSWDEVSIGYNAYSILKTGRDEHGKLFPLDTFIGYGDYKPPVTIYVTIPFVAMFGLTEIAVRLPSAIFGTLTILCTYFLVCELFRKRKDANIFGLVSAAVLTFSPWHINLSRGGFEANIALFFIVLGVLMMLKSRQNLRLIPFIWVPFVISIYTFNSSRYFVPLFSPVLLWYCFSGTIRKINKRLLFSFIIGFVILLPLLPHLLSPESRLRFKEVNIFTDSSVVENSNARTASMGNTFFANTINNRRVGYFISYMKHYLDNIEPSFLFTKGDGNPKFSIQDVGQFYLVELPFLLFGLYTLFATEPKESFLLLLWLLLAIVPAGVARETPHALRILNSLPTWHIFIASGIIYLLSFFKKKSFRWGAIGIIGICYFGNVLFYLHNYYTHYPYEYSGEWQYGYREAIRYAESVKSKYQTIVVTEYIGRPYMYTLFYGKYDPNEFFRTKDDSFDAAGFYHVFGFGKYRFVETKPATLSQNTLYILPSDQVPNTVHIIQTVRLLNGKPVLVIFES